MNISALGKKLTSSIGNSSPSIDSKFLTQMGMTQADFNKLPDKEKKMLVDQANLSKQAELVTLLSNILKKNHDTAMSLVSNFK